MVIIDNLENSLSDLFITKKLVIIVFERAHIDLKSLPKLSFFVTPTIFRVQ